MDASHDAAVLTHHTLVPEPSWLYPRAQPSSADVERLFSQLKLIPQQVGVSGLEESYEKRLMVCANRL